MRVGVGFIRAEDMTATEDLEPDSDDEGEGVGGLNGEGEAVGGLNGADEDQSDGDSELDSDDEAGFMGEYGEQMERELFTSTVGASFERYGGAGDGNGDGVSARPSQGEGAADDERGEGEPVVEPVDVDGNMLKHILESFASQEGAAGPASNLLRELGAGL